MGGCNKRPNWPSVLYGLETFGANITVNTQLCSILRLARTTWVWVDMQMLRQKKSHTNQTDSESDYKTASIKASAGILKTDMVM